MRRTVEIAAIALGSFIAFAMEPLVGRVLLSVFGGTAAVWVTCLVAFQILLVAGYFYAHWVCGHGFSRARLVAHLMALVCGAAWCVAAGFFGDSVRVIAAFPCAPALKTLLGVLVICAVPFVVLSANSSLVQVLAGGRFRLYAVSNVGSLAGLLAYPILIEPFLSLDAQWFSVGAAILVYTVLLSVLVGAPTPNREPKTLEHQKSEAPNSELQQSEAPNPELLKSESPNSELQKSETQNLKFEIRNLKSSTPHSPPLAHFLLSFAGVFVLNAVTAHLTGNVAPIPLLWAMLLAVYLLTFIIGFSGWGEKALTVWNLLALASVGAAIWAFSAGDAAQKIFMNNALAGGAVLFFGCTAIHSKLYAIRPDGADLTRYYLCIALGGAVGGLFSGFAIPLVTTWIVEYPAALLLVAAIAAFSLPVEEFVTLFAARPIGSRRQLAAVAFVLFALPVYFTMCVRHHTTLARGRSFYGAWSVVERSHVNNFGEVFRNYEFMHGGTIHGLESADGFLRGKPTAYFGKDAGGLSFLTHPEYDRRGLRVGIIGLGIGTLAWYERAQDSFDFFEICPEVIRVALTDPRFDFMSARKGKGAVIEGDARQILERQRTANAPKYDVLVIDAYSGDSIPYHLITKEAFHLYGDRLAKGGTLAIHITNWHIDLFPVAKAAAKELGFDIKLIAGRGGNLTMPSNWALMSKKGVALPKDIPYLNMSQVCDVELPTDKKGSLITYLRCFR